MTRRHILSLIFTFLCVTLALSGCNKKAESIRTIPDNMYFENLIICYEQRCADIQFSADDTVPFGSIINYYTFGGCYDVEKKQMRDEVVNYYDTDTGCFTVPSDVVETYLSSRFNTAPDKSAVSFYDAETDCYAFPYNSGEYYYNVDIVSKEAVGDNKFEVRAVITKSLNTSDANSDTKLSEFVFDTADGSAKYLSVGIVGTGAESDSETEDDIELFEHAINTYEQSVAVELNDGTVLDYEDIFGYFTASACYDEEGNISEEMQQYCDFDYCFTIPRQVADDYLTSRFNITPDAASVRFYDTESDCYIFRRTRHTMYVSPDVLKVTGIGENTYEVNALVSAVPPYDEYIAPMLKKYVFEVTDGCVKYISVTVEKSFR